ncbi:MAG: hypothetical protein IIZ10_05425 [Solobacterium sp.]|nr:hypothetical protein [Solobacterium sp.]
MIADQTNGLPRYCHPYHGGWDVARIALDIPESRILFVCPVSCARIICLNAVKYGYKDRIDVLALTEDDIVSGNYEEKTIEAACYVLDHLEKLPKALILYVSCIDAMLGNDHSFQTQEIMDRYPGVNCFVLKMCPITRYSGDLPLVALQHDMYAPLPEAKVPHTKTAVFIGTNIAYSPENELVRLLEDSGYRALHIQASDSYDDYLAVRESSLNLCLMPFGKSACEMLKERYDTPFVPYFARYDYGSIRSTLSAVCSALDLPLPDFAALEAETTRILKETAEYIGDTEIVIDGIATLFPDTLRSTLESCGFRIRRVYSDSVDRKLPDLDSGEVTMPLRRSYKSDDNVIAIGMVSASFEGAGNAIDIFYDNGWWGHDGLRKISAEIRNAYDHPRSSEMIREETRR